MASLTRGAAALVLLVIIASLSAPAARAFCVGASTSHRSVTCAPSRCSTVRRESPRASTTLPIPVTAVYLTLTLPLSGGGSSDYFFASRRLPDAVQAQKVASLDRSAIMNRIFPSDDGQLLWMCFQNATVLAVLLSDCTTAYNIPLMMPPGNSIRYWTLSEHANGAPCPAVLATSHTNTSTVLWPLPSGAVASAPFPSRTLGFYTTHAADRTPVLYAVYLTLTATSALFSATWRNLMDGSRVDSAAPPLSLPRADFEFAACSFPLAATNVSAPIAFFVTLNGSTEALLLLLDPPSLSLTSSPIRVALAPLYPHMYCGPTAAPTRFLLWTADIGVEGRSGGAYILDLLNASVSPFDVPRPDGMRLAAVQTCGSGGAVFALCDALAGDVGARECRHLYYDSLDATERPPDAEREIASLVEPTFGAAVERNGLILLLLESLDRHTQPRTAFVVYNTTSRVPLGYVGLPLAALSAIDARAAALDDARRVYVAQYAYPDTDGLLAVFEWYNITSVYAAGALYGMQSLTGLPHCVPQHLQVRGDSLVLANGDLGALVRLSIPRMTLVSALSVNFTVTGLSFAGDAVYALGPEGVYQLPADLSSVTHA